MKLLTTQSVINDNYIFTFSIDQTSISSDDNANFLKYGPQNINFGSTTSTVNTYGTFTTTAVNCYASYNTTTSLGVASTTDTFILPDNWFALPTAFPVQVTFGSVSPSVFATNSSVRLLAYREYIQSQVYAAVVGLRSLSASDSFTGQFITNI